MRIFAVMVSDLIDWIFQGTGRTSQMLNFDPARFAAIQEGALALEDQIHGTIGRLVEAGAKNIFFLGAGGAGKLMQPAVQLLQRSTNFPVFLERPAEIIATDSANLGPGSIVVIPSLSGTTKEAIAALEFSKAKGAIVITLTGHSQSFIALNADYNFTNFAEDDTSSESFYLQSLVLALSLLNHLGQYEEYGNTLAELSLLPRLLIEIKRNFEADAARIADRIKDETYHIITGAGPTWTQAWYYGTCILEEMQWIRTRPIHAADFFHGTLELLEKDVSVLVFKGEDASRPLVERLETWASTISERVIVIDAAEFELPGISSHTRSLISHVLIATVLERVSAHLEVLRGHPLTTRRYYKRVAY